jgi:alkylation response protein AidB-like acyl-CoA dehydrogenase
MKKVGVHGLLGVTWPKEYGDIAGPGGQLRVHTQGAPMRGRAELTYRATVVETIGGGTSEIQKNIIARHKLGLPPNF